MPPAFPRLLTHYAIALLCVWAAIRVGTFFEPTFGDGFPFAAMIVAVLIAGWRGGFGPGLVTALLGATALIRYVLSPDGSFQIHGVESQAGIILYLVVTIGMAFICGLMRRAVSRAELRTQEVTKALEEKLLVERNLNRTTRQLERSDSFHRLITELTSDFTFRATLDGQTLNVDYVSAGFHAITGYKLEELTVAGAWKTLVLPEDLPRVESAFQRAIEGHGERSEFRIASKSGRLCHLRYLLQPLRDEFNQVIGLVGAAQDVTEQRQLESERQKLMNALAEKNAFIEAVLRQVPVGIVVADAQTGRLVTCNSEAERITSLRFAVGECVQEISQREAIRGLRPDGTTYEPDQWPIQRAILGETIQAEKVAVCRPAHETLHLSVNAGPIRDQAGQVIAAVSVFYDETERRLSEERVIESQRFLRCSLDSLASHVAVLDEHGCILEVNEAWRRFADDNQFTLYNYGVGSSYLAPFENAELECGDGAEIARGIRDVISGKRDTFEFEYPCHSPDQQRWFLLRVTPFKTPGPRRVVIAHENVTKLRQALDSLRDADRRKDEFLATLAHELRNPLAPIRNAVEILKLPNCDADSRHGLLEMVERQTLQLTRLVDDLLDVSRVMRGKIELRLASTRLRDVVNQAVETVAPLINSCQHQLELELPDEQVCVSADAVRLSQVLSNLLTNAAKYTEPGGKIRVQAMKEGDDAVVRIIDSGIGIAPDYLNGIFDLFVQVDPTGTRSQGGLGIGLTLAKNLIELHGGSITASSRGLGQGSEFIVRIPLAILPEHSGAKTRAPGSATCADHLSCHQDPCDILVVDDNRDAANSLAMLLRTLGHKVQVAHSGESALQTVAMQTPDVVFLDIGMPGMDGYEVARRLRANAKFDRVCLAALTGWGQAEDRRRTADAGFDHHIVKPPDLDTLISVLPSRDSLAREPST